MTAAGQSNASSRYSSTGGNSTIIATAKWPNEFPHLITGAPHMSTTHSLFADASTYVRGRVAASTH